MRVNVFPKNNNEPMRLQIYIQGQRKPVIDYALDDQKTAWLISKLAEQLATAPQISLNQKINSQFKDTELCKKIMEFVAQEFDIEERDLIASCQLRNYARPRQVAMYLTQKHCRSFTITEIGRIFQKDRTSINYSVDKIKDLMLGDLELAERIEVIEENLHSWILRRQNVNLEAVYE